jgi:N-acetylglucosaminyldiphosphoundecaprenol N-acetyl-beta-D-mannosaminyltransferase
MSEVVEVNPPQAGLFDLDVVTSPLRDCTGLAARWVRHGGAARTIACLNPHSAALASRDPEFHAALASADMLIPDGIGVVLAARLLGTPVAERVTGSDIFEGLCSALDAEGGRSCFFLGSTQKTLELIEKKMAERWPRLHVAGTYSPPFAERFSPEEDAAMCAAVNAAKPDVLWVGMTAPKQEKWIARNRKDLQVPVIAAVGAVFDYFAGTVRRPHPLLQRLGLEWAGRILAEPGRMWKRTVFSGPVFAKMVLEEALHRRRSRLS